MALHIVCACGQTLWADERFAGHEMHCPLCARTLVVPPARTVPSEADLIAVPPVPTSTVVEVGKDWFDPAPLAERTMAASVYQLAEAFPKDDFGDLYSPDKKKNLERILHRARKELAGILQLPPWPLENGWRECMLYPFRAMGLSMLLAFVGASAASIIALVTAQPEIATWVVLAGFLFAHSLYVFACLRSAWLSGLHGEAGFVRWPGSDVRFLAQSSGLAAALFLAGPIVPALTAFLFWLHAGDLHWIDRLILLELGVLSVGYFILEVFAADAAKLRQATPAGVLRLIKTVGHLPLTAALAGSVGLVLHAWAGLASLRILHEDPGAGWALLFCTWVSVLSWNYFLCRWVGVYIYRRRARAGRAGEQYPRL